MKELLFALINESAKGPYREPDSVGFDMFACGPHILNPGDTKIIPLGFHAALDAGYGAFVWDRSSFGAKGIHIFRQLIENPSMLKDMADIVTFGGCLDWSYRGQWGVILHNFTDKIYAIEHQAKIGQFVIQKCELPVPRQIPMDELLAIPSLRGQGGFGSTDGQNTAESAQAKISEASVAPKGRVINTDVIKESVSPAESVKRNG